MSGKGKEGNKAQVKVARDCDANAETGDKAIADHIVSIANLSMQTEKERDASLKGFAEQLLTSVTILSVAYLTPLQLVLDVENGLGESWPRIVGFVYLALIVPLVLAMVLALASIDLHGEELLSSPVEQFNYFNDACEKLNLEEEKITCLGTAKSYCEALNNEYEALERKHERMIRLLKKASKLVIFSVSIAVLGIVALFISIL